MSVEEPTFYEQKFVELIPQRGVPPYFVHSGKSENGMVRNVPVVHGVTHITWEGALFEIGDLTSFGEHIIGQQILADMPESLGLLTTDELATLQHKVVFDMNNPEDVTAFRNAHEELKKY